MLAPAMAWCPALLTAAPRRRRGCLSAGAPGSLLAAAPPRPPFSQPLAQFLELRSRRLQFAFQPLLSLHRLAMHSAVIARLPALLYYLAPQLGYLAPACRRAAFRTSPESSHTSFLSTPFRLCPELPHRYTEYLRAYRDSKVATVSAVAVDKEGAAHCTNTSCVIGIEHADEFFPRIEVEMSRRSHRVAALLLVILGDGASWIWARAADLAESGQKVWYILDFWHACDHLAKISKTLYGEATEQFSTCYERWRSLLWQGCVAAVIKELKELHASGRYTDKQCYDIQGEINYFTENKERMDYPLYRSVPLPIGSGVVESACKNVVAARMKQSGMMWTLDGAKDMLQLRASVKSRRFWSDFENLLPSSPPQQTDEIHLEAA